MDQNEKASSPNPAEHMSYACSDVLEDFLRQGYIDDINKIVASECKDPKLEPEQIVKNIQEECARSIRTLNNAFSDGSLLKSRTVRLNNSLSHKNKTKPNLLYPSSSSTDEEDDNDSSYKDCENESHKIRKNYLKGEEKSNASVDNSYLYSIPQSVKNIINEIQRRGDLDFDLDAALSYNLTNAQENSIVNVSFSSYAKFLALLLTLNTVFLCKILFWDTIGKKLIDW